MQTLAFLWVFFLLLVQVNTPAALQLTNGKEELYCPWISDESRLMIHRKKIRVNPRISKGCCVKKKKVQLDYLESWKWDNLTVQLLYMVLLNHWPLVCAVSKPPESCSTLTLMSPFIDRFCFCFLQCFCWKLNWVIQIFFFFFFLICVQLCGKIGNNQTAFFLNV